MSTGYPITKLDLDNRIGQMVTALRDDLNAIVQFKGLLDDTSILPDSFLQGTLAYTTTETALIRSAFTALSKLSDIARGAATQSPASDFWFDAKHLAGLNFH
jgi:hypothetical protein